MSSLDRDEAREALRFLLPDGDVMETLLDRLEECVRPFAWQDLEDLLAEHYPEDIFPVRADDPSGDPGPRILSLARLLSRADAKLARIEELPVRHHADGSSWVRVRDIADAIGEPPANG